MNSAIFDGPGHDQLSPHQRPPTAPAGSGSPGPTDSYFPNEETRRPSVASVATNASSTGSKSSIGRTIINKLFGPTDQDDSGRTSELSIHQNASRQQLQQRPGTPTGPPRPRTPVPSSEVVPFLYQDPQVGFGRTCVMRVDG